MGGKNVLWLRSIPSTKPDIRHSCRRFKQKNHSSRATFHTAWVTSNRAISHENLLMTPIPWKRTFSGSHCNLVLLCNRGVRPCKTTPILSDPHSSGYPGTKESW